ncbi:glycosyltransferase family 4 protein [Clostridium sp. UBA7339]|uniref:glycosyltransferase family 4 protein n=1 Tax=Clostridium sp. UBA7339 TaxID=1946376 RepID=UPI00321719F3
MKRCLHILPMNKLSGAEKMVLLICKNLTNYESIVLCGGDKLKKSFEDNNINSYSLSFSKKHILKNIKYLKNIIRDNDIKIVHAHDNNASIHAYLVKSIYGVDIKVISHIHSCYPWINSNGLNSSIDKLLRPKYDYNITCGKVVYDFYKENTNYLNREKISILSNAMDVEEIINFKSNKRAWIATKYIIPQNGKVIGFVGRLDEEKGLIPFIKEFDKYKEKFIDTKIFIIGSGTQEEEIRSMVKKLELGEFFIFTGFEENVYDFFPIIDVFFLPSLYEGLPMVILEAMAFGIPVVAMDVGSISEVINSHRGRLIKPGDYRSFMEELRNLKEDKQLRIDLGKNGREFIKTNYNIKNYCKKIEKIYDSISK